MGDDENKTNNSEQKSQNDRLWMEGSTDTILTAAKKINISKKEKNN